MKLHKKENKKEDVNPSLGVNTENDLTDVSGNTEKSQSSNDKFSDVSKLTSNLTNDSIQDNKFSAIKDYASVLIVFSIVFLLIFLVIIPQYKATQVNKNSIEKLEKKSQKVSGHLKYLQLLSSLKDELEENKKLAYDAVPKDEDVPYFLNQLINIADSSNVELVGLSFGGVSKSTKPTEASMVKANMTVKGEYYDVLDFLKRLEESRKLIYADNIRVTIGGPSDGGKATETTINSEDKKNGTYTLSLTLTSFFMPDPDTEKLDIDTLTSKPQPEPVLRKIKSMKYYEPAEVDLKVGTLNPFVKNEDKVDQQKGQSTNSNESASDTTGTTVGTQKDTNTGQSNTATGNDSENKVKYDYQN